MTKFTETQLFLLAAAAQRPDRLLPFGERVKGAAAYRSGRPLVQRGYAISVDARLGDPLWLQEVSGKRHALRITVRGLLALGIEPVVHDLVPDGIWTDPAENASVLEDIRLQEAIWPAAGVPVSAEKLAAFLQAPAKARLASKKALVIELLGREEGASIKEIIAATGWLAHTTRAMLSGLRKAGSEIETVRQAASATRYRIVDAQCGGDDHAEG